MQPSASSNLRRADVLTRLLRDLDPRVIDVLMALTLTAVALTVEFGRPANGDFRKDDLLGAVLVAGQTLPLVARRAAPLGVAIVISLALVAYSWAGYEVAQAGTFSSLIATFSAASLTDNRRGIIVGGVAAAAIAAFFATNRGDWSIADVATVSGTWAIAWLAGTFVRVRGEQVEVAGARASRLEQERDLRAREAVADERARMARELHDIVGHALNVIVLQAAGARRVFDTRPDVPRDALAAIESTGREALSEMERMLGVLSAAATADGPQPGLAQLAGLAAHVSEAGIPVNVVVEGDRPDVPASVDLSAYRIVQESLTNCLKHSGASRATVTVRYRAAELEVEIIDNGHGPSQHEPRGGGGRGQVGMRERVALFGGDISFGALSPAGGYRVLARLPYRSIPS